MNIKKTWIELGSIQIEDLLTAISSLQFSEMLFCKINNHLVLHVSCGYDNHIFSIVHSLVKSNDHVSRNFMNIVYLSQYWQAHHMVPINVEVNIFHECFKAIIVSRLQFLPNCVFFKLYVESLVETVAEHVS